MEGRGERRDWFGEPDDHLKEDEKSTGKIITRDVLAEAEDDMEADSNFKPKPNPNNPDLSIL